MNGILDFECLQTIKVPKTFLSTKVQLEPMRTLKVEGDDEIIERFKEKAREKYGHKRGSIKKATMELMEKWVDEQEVDWSELRGVIDSDKTSTELKKEMWKKVD